MDYPKVTTLDIFKEYWKYAKAYTHYIIIIVLSISIGTALMSVYVPTLYKKFFDMLQGVVDISSISPNPLHLVLLIFGYNLVGWLLYRFAMVSITRLESFTMRDIRQGAYDYTLQHSLNFFSNNFAGSLVQKINRFTRSFERITDRLLMDVIPLTIKVVGISVVMISMDRRIALVLAIWIVFFLLLSFGINKIKLKYDIEAAKVDSKISAVLSDSISNHNSVQLFNGSSLESEIFNNVNERFSRVFLTRFDLAELINAIQIFLAMLVEFAIFYYGIKYWQVGVYSIGIFTMLQAYIITLNNSFWNFNRIVRDLYEATADAREMVEILRLPHEIQDTHNAQELSVVAGSIEFKNVNFSFGKSKENNKPVFTNFNLSIKPGEKVALIGSSGAGKSTFVKLLLRLHDIQSGEILVDDQNIKLVTQNSLRRNISLVPQDPALFHRTLMENIRYGNREASDEQVIEASRLAHCDIFIKDLPFKYNTFVGERGVKLSGGERQRVAIARALLKNAPILILDEATSSLDSHSESLIQDALNTLMKGKTTIVIAHRLSTIKKVDRIVVLGKEGIIEQGSHSELLDKNGTYAHLWNIQAGGFADRSIEDLLDK